MKANFWATLALVAASFTVAAPVFAHHGAAAYDVGKTISVSGTVTSFDFSNPHVLVSLDGKVDKGTMQKWEGELTSPNHLSRAGWSRTTLKPGEHITIVGNPAKSGASTVWIRKVLDASGNEISTGQGGDN